MKKTICILVSILIISIMVISCSIYKDFPYDYNELLENVQEINIVDVERDGYDGELNISILEEVDKNDYNDFLLSLSNITYESGILMHPHNVTGVSIMLIYDSINHNYDLVGTRAIEKFENNIKTIHMNMGCNSDEFNNLINKYYTND